VGALRQSALTPHGKAVRLFASLCSHHYSARRRKALPIWRGTDGSNPAPSSGESRANLNCVSRRHSFSKTSARQARATALAHADQAERDHAALKAAARAGIVDVQQEH
jgi:hypothetical protein